VRNEEVNSQSDISSRMERHPTLHTPAGPKFGPFFSDRIISKGLWPPRSPDLTPPDYFLWGYLKGTFYQNKTTNHRRLKSKHHQRNSDSDNGRTGKDFSKDGVPCSILFGRKWWPLPAHVMMSHFSHNERTAVQIWLQYLHWFQVHGSVHRR
jgi:hypothetical protein